MEKNLNCCQKVFVSFVKEAGIDKDTAIKLGAGFGGGACSGELCGAVSGAIMVLGLRYSGAGLCSPPELLGEFQDRFKKKYGSLRCKEILQYDFSIPGEKQRAIENGVIAENCPKIIAEAKSILSDIVEKN